MLDHHAFREARRSGSVDDVGQSPRIGFRQQHGRIENLCRVADVDGLCVPGLGICLVRRVRNHNPCARIVDDVAKSGRRLGTVHRHITRTGFPDRQDRHEDVGRDLQADTDHFVRLHATRDEAPGERRGAVVEIAERHRTPAVQRGDRHRVGMLAHVARDHFVNGGNWPRDVWRVPATQEARPLVLTDEIQRRHRRVRPGEPGVQRAQDALE